MQMAVKCISVLQIGLLWLIFITTIAYASNQCYSCNGINCLRTSTKTATENCLYDLDSCVTIFEKFTVVAKGCLLNMPIEMRRKCEDISNPECQVCTGKLCNHLGRSDFKCYQCDEKEDTKCANNIQDLSPVQCEAPTAPNSYCFTDTRDNRVKRGCSLNIKEQKECLDDTQCSLCIVEDRRACNDINYSRSAAPTISATVTLIILCLSITRSRFAL